MCFSLLSERGNCEQHFSNLAPISLPPSSPQRILCPTTQASDVDAGRHGMALLLRGSVTDVPAGTIWLLVELMPFCPSSAVSSKSLFSLSHKSRKWTVGILRPYTAVFSRHTHLTPWHIFHDPNKLVPTISAGPLLPWPVVLNYLKLSEGKKRKPL